MKIFGITGWSGSGKTTLMVKLLEDLIKRGFKVSTIKHTHHSVDVDRPGKDSFEHRHAGAHEVMLTGAKRWALMRELRGSQEPDMQTLLDRMEFVDIVLVEGFKRYLHPKLEIFRPKIGKPMIAAKDKTIVAIATDEQALPQINLPVLDIDNVPMITEFVISHLGFNKRGSSDTT
ncbi:MAG: Molybdopterin-guanine dinucleotide biosynthesis adapter protein [Alphaproteobacteria bacterium MarineAlpha3_Bin5]|nr:molybdopterin-guanine dinucleotide biosynthesis protein B [Magnetovibrio sp.]PPR76422.1 MAG: Molybdopterin-guanine dinucleotide biosynthesis adapter protein [Alphaproteobacteria bacterium MarineAlpha3_Bin5]|tara:strand:+ start:636 stop:1160 length:525 start_codon:yes stop_codon:yes gene_type:complete